MGNILFKSTDNTSPVNPDDTRPRAFTGRQLSPHQTQPRTTDNMNTTHTLYQSTPHSVETTQQGISLVADTPKALRKNVIQLKDKKNTVSSVTLKFQASKKDVKVLSSLPALRKLDVSNTTIEIPVIQSIADTLPHLEDLDVSLNTFGDQKEFLTAVLKMPSLTSLSAMNTLIGDTVVSGISTSTTLRSLDISLNNIGNDGMNKLKQMRQLSYLDVRNNNADAEVVEALANTLKNCDVQY